MRLVGAAGDGLGACALRGRVLCDAARCDGGGALVVGAAALAALVVLYGELGAAARDGVVACDGAAWSCTVSVAGAVLLPPALAKLIERRIREGTSPSAIEPTAENDPAYLFPGRPATRPRSPGALAKQPLQADLPGVVARNTVMFNMAIELPPIIISDLRHPPERRRQLGRPGPEQLDRVHGCHHGGIAHGSFPTVVDPCESVRPVRARHDPPPGPGLGDGPRSAVAGGPGRRTGPGGVRTGHGGAIRCCPAVWR